MGLRIVKGWPKTASERAVKAWLDKKGIDTRGVLSYKTFTELGSTPTIQITMHFDEEEE